MVHQNVCRLFTDRFSCGVDMSFYVLLIISSADMQRTVACSFWISFDQKGTRKENGVGLEEGTKGSAGTVASRRAMASKGEVTAVSVFPGQSRLS